MINLKDKKQVVILVVIIVIIVLGLGVFIIKKQFTKDTPSNSTADTIDMSINTDDGDEKIDWSKYTEQDYELSKSITIDKDGIYKLTGTINDGLITVNTTGNVKLMLNNVNITNSNGPAIFIEDAEDVVIELVNGSKNYLEDGSNYSIDDNNAGTIYSKSDITIQGDGTLEVKSNNEDAIVGKDDLKIVSGTYIITSADDGIRGKDSVYIKNGTFTINSEGDGIKSTNDTNTEKGFIKIENGDFTITAGLDGIQAERKILIQNGTFNITTGGGSSNSSNNESWGNWGRPTNPNIQNNKNTASAKGIKSVDNLVIENGTFIFNTSDDSIHCNNNAGIKNGNFTISSGDDGIHADTELIIDNGIINITKSYEGLEASKITINDGTISVVSTDDGINVAGGKDSSSMDRRGQNNYSNNSENILTINGGNIYVNATGDGLDANGSIYMNGGNVKVDGPTNSGNGALDYDRTFEVNGGTLLAGGASGMAQGVSSSSKIYNVMINFNSSYSNGDIISIVDSNGKEIISYSSSKSYSSLVIASPDLKKGKKYTIKVNGNDYESFTISNISTTIGNSNGMGNHGGNGMNKPDGYGKGERPERR